MAKAHFWTIEDVQRFNEFVKSTNENYSVEFPVQETMNGQFLLRIKGTSDVTVAQTLYEKFTEEVLNG
jgi:hypothetical protein